MLNRNKDQKGFTLIELIVVLAVASVLTAVFVPQFYHYVGNSKKSSCRQARENLLAIFERKVYAGEYAIGDIDSFLESTEFEVTDNTCPESGTYEGEVTGNRVYIKCNIQGHDDPVFADIEGYNGTETESEDNPIPIPTLPPIVTPSVTEEVPTEGEPTPTPTPTPTPAAIWPYLDDERWDEFEGQDWNNMKVEISVPSGLFETPLGNWYVVVGSGTTFTIWRNQMNNGNPEFYGGPEDYRDKNYLIKYSGVTWTEETLHFINNKSQFEGVRYGDIVICNGVSYINQNLGGADKGNWPLSGNPCGQFYKVNP